MSQANPTEEEVNLYAESYALYGDQTKAFRNAFPLSKATPEAQHVNASRLHKNPKVQLRIGQLQSIIIEKAKDRFDRDSDWLLNRLFSIDDLDILDIITDDFKGFRPLSEWPREWRISISGIDMITTQAADENIESIINKIKMPDKVKNLELIGKHVNIKAWEKEIKVSNTTNNIMPVPQADSIESWEGSAQKQQEKILNQND